MHRFFVGYKADRDSINWASGDNCIASGDRQHVSGDRQLISGDKSFIHLVNGGSRW